MDTVSIVSTGRYIPEFFELSEDAVEEEKLEPGRIRDLGVYKVHVDKADECYEMAVKAAKSAVGKAGITAEEIDAVVVSSGYGRKFLIHDDAAYLRQRIGAKKASAFRVEQGCNSSIVSLNYAYSRLRSDRDVKNILIISYEFFKKPFINRWKSVASSIFADGASAAVIRRSTAGFNILGTYGVTDGYFCDIWRTDTGGLKRPFVKNRDTEVAAFDYDIYKTAAEYLCSDDKREMLQNTLVQNNKVVFDRLLERLRISYSDINKLVMYNVGLSVLKKIVEIVGIEEEKTSMYLAREYGHMGNADILFNLDHMLGDKKFEDGDIVGLFSAGVGFSWGSVLLKYSAG